MSPLGYTDRYTREASLTDTVLEFYDNNLTIILKPRTYVEEDYNVIAFGIESTTPNANITVLGSDHITTGTLYVTNISSDNDHGGLDFFNGNVHMANNGDIFVSSLFVDNPRTMSDLSYNEVVTKEPLIKHLHTNYSNVEVSNAHFVSYENLVGQVDYYHLANEEFVINKLNEFTGNAGPFDWETFVPYSEMANVIQESVTIAEIFTTQYATIEANFVSYAAFEGQIANYRLVNEEFVTNQIETALSSVSIIDELNEQIDMYRGTLRLTELPDRNLRTDIQTYINHVYGVYSPINNEINEGNHGGLVTYYSLNNKINRNNVVIERTIRENILADLEIGLGDGENITIETLITTILSRIHNTNIYARREEVYITDIQTLINKSILLLEDDVTDAQQSEVRNNNYFIALKALLDRYYVRIDGVNNTPGQPLLNSAAFVTQQQLYSALINVNSGYSSTGNVTVQYLVENEYARLNTNDLSEYILSVMGGGNSADFVTTSYLDSNNYARLESNELSAYIQEIVDNHYGDQSVTLSYLQNNYVSLETWQTYFGTMHIQPSPGCTGSGSGGVINGITLEYLMTVLTNYITRTEFEEAVIGGGGITMTQLNNALQLYLTRNDAITNYVSMTEWLEFKEGHTHDDDGTGTGTGRPSGPILKLYPTTNVFNMDITSSIIQVDYALNKPNQISSFHHTASEAVEPYIYFTLSDNKIDGVSPNIGDVFLVQHPIHLNPLYVDDMASTINGVFTIVGIEVVHSTTIRCLRYNDFNASENILNGRVVYVKRKEDGGVANETSGHTFIVSIPAPIEIYFNYVCTFVPLCNYDIKSMAKQDNTNVNITGGNISVPLLRASEIKPYGDTNAVSIILPDIGSKFTVRASDIETNTDIQNDVVFQVDTTGLVSAFQFNSLSDRSLKKNDKTITNSLDLIKKLNGKTFEWKDESKNEKGRSYGFIAQEVEEHFPTLVAETLNGHLAVDYAKVVAILVESVKSIHDRLIDAGISSNPNYYGTSSGSGSGSGTSSGSGQTHVHSTTSCSCCPLHHDGGDTSTPSPSPSPPTPTPTELITNIIGMGGNKTVFVDLASTPYDSIEITELFGDSNNYVLYTNGGNNMLDDANIETNDKVCIKDCPNKKFNGVFIVQHIQTGPVGKFSRCIRSNDYKTFGNIHHSMVYVNPSGLYGTGKGNTNPGTSFTCIEPSNIDSFVIDESEIDYMSFGPGTNIRSMASQDSDNVNITGGNIDVNSISISDCRPLEGETEVTIRLNGTSTADKFRVTNATNKELMVVDGRGVVSARDFYAPSDKNLKKNEKPITNALDLVRKLRGVTFDWKDFHSNHPNYGFIAQEVAIHFPSLVHERTDGMMTVDYSKIVSILVEAVKDIGNLLNM
jgi:hypothetical protein